MGVSLIALQLTFKDPWPQSVMEHEAAPLALSVEAVIALLPYLESDAVGQVTDSHLEKTCCRFSVAVFGGAPDADVPLPRQLVEWRHASFSGPARVRATGGMIPASVADAAVR